MKSIVILVAAALAGCGGDHPDTCAACDRSFTSEECHAIAIAAGCSRGESYTATLCSPPTQGCRFYGCHGSHPMCRAPSVDAAADLAGADLARSAECVAADNDFVGKGLFVPGVLTCPNIESVTVNGNRREACRCGDPCPCGYACGSIRLNAGGTIGSVCAPR